jgi:hypothetical protein
MLVVLPLLHVSLVSITRIVATVSEQQQFSPVAAGQNDYQQQQFTTITTT